MALSTVYLALAAHLGELYSINSVLLASIPTGLQSLFSDPNGFTGLQSLLSDPNGFTGIIEDFIYATDNNIHESSHIAMGPANENEITTIEAKDTLKVSTTLKMEGLNEGSNSNTAPGDSMSSSPGGGNNTTSGDISGVVLESVEQVHPEDVKTPEGLRDASSVQDSTDADQDYVANLEDRELSVSNFKAVYEDSKLIDPDNREPSNENMSARERAIDEANKKFNYPKHNDEPYSDRLTRESYEIEENKVQKLNSRLGALEHIARTRGLTQAETEEGERLEPVCSYWLDAIEEKYPHEISKAKKIEDYIDTRTGEIEQTEKNTNQTQSSAQDQSNTQVQSSAQDQPNSQVQSSRENQCSGNLTDRLMKRNREDSDVTDRFIKKNREHSDD